MSGMDQTVNLSHAAARTQRALAAAKAYMELKMPDKEIISRVSGMFDVSPDVAEDFLNHVKEHPDPEEW